MMKTNLVCLSVTGPDAGKFLQGQVTSDIAPLAWQAEKGAGGIGVSARLDLKGRVTASFWLLGVPDGFWLLLPPTRAETLLADLKKYALFSRVTLRLETLTISGGAEPRQEAGNVVQAADGLVAQLPFSQRYLLMQTDATALTGSADAWRLADIRAGFSPLETGAEGLWLPQELHLDTFDGVSFNKGCYFGQEVVARVHFKGKVKQHLMSFSCIGELTSSTAPTAPVAGSWLVDDADKRVGQVVTAVVELRQDVLQLHCAAVARDMPSGRLQIADRMWRVNAS